LHWLVTARVDSQSEKCTLASVSDLIGRASTTVGGIVVAGTYTVPSCLGVSSGPTFWTSSPIAGVARAAQTAAISLLLK